MEIGGIGYPSMIAVLHVAVGLRIAFDFVMIPSLWMVDLTVKGLHLSCSHAMFPHAQVSNIAIYDQGLGVNQHVCHSRFQTIVSTILDIDLLFMTIF